MSALRRSVEIAFLALAAISMPIAAGAQATGAIAGLVLDESRAVLPGVTVEATNEETGQIRSAVSLSDGLYTIPLLAPGVYTVKGTLSGFASLTRQGVRVTVTDTSRVDLTLTVGQLTQEVTVVGEAPLIETANATMGIVIDQQQVVDLPLNGRNFAQLGTLIPGVVAAPGALGGAAGDATPGGQGNVTGSFSVNGMRSQSNSFLLDGSENNDTFNTGFILRPPPDAIQEFKILTHSFNAEYGRNAGSIVNVVTKSGSNQWHGSGWEFNRDDALQARNFFAAPNQDKPTLKQNQFGAAIGGPLRKNALFGFGYYDGFRNTSGSTSNSVVLSEAQSAGNFAGGAAIRDPLTGLPFPGNVIPAGRIDPIASRLLRDFVPLPNSPANRYVVSPDIEDERDQFGLRLDLRATDKSSFLARYAMSNTEQVNPTTPSVFSPTPNAATATLQDGMLSHTYLASARAINVVRLGWNRISAHPHQTSGVNAADYGWNIVPSNPLAVGLPLVGVSGFFTLGDTAQPFASRVNQVLQLSDDLTLIRGRHSLKAGVQLRRDEVELAFINRPNGDFSFNGTYTGNAAADFLLGLPSLYRQATGDPTMSGRSWNVGLYAQDEFRFSDRLTLNLGVRYDISTPFEEKDGKLNAYYPGQQSERFPVAPRGLVYPGDPGVPDGTYATDLNNVAPRVSFAWDPTGSGTNSLRGAVGLFYDTLSAQGDFFQNGTLAPPFQPLTQANYPVSNPTHTFHDPLQGAPAGAAFPPGLIFIGWGPEFRTPSAVHYNLSLQRQVGVNAGMEIGYVGSRGYNLPNFFEVNPTIPILTPTPRVGPRLDPAYSIIRPSFSEARSWYDALQASLRIRPWHGFSGLVAYTWGHAIDHASGHNLGPDTMPLLPVTIGDEQSIERALAREKGDSYFDVRHRFVVSFSYSLPGLDGQGALARNVLGHWQLNGIVQAQTGFPLTVNEGVNVSLTSLANRPNVICDPNADAPRTVTQWFNTACFERLTLPDDAGAIGDANRSTVVGPGFSQVDLSLFKNIELPRRHRIQLRLEGFNILNQTRFGQPGRTIGLPTFGVIATAEDGRIIQLGVKYIF